MNEKQLFNWLKINTGNTILSRIENSINNGMPDLLAFPKCKNTALIELKAFNSNKNLTIPKHHFKKHQIKWMNDVASQKIKPFNLLYIIAITCPIPYLPTTNAYVLNIDTLNKLLKIKSPTIQWLNANANLAITIIKPNTKLPPEIQQKLIDAIGN